MYRKNHSHFILIRVCAYALTVATGLILNDSPIVGKPLGKRKSKKESGKDKGKVLRGPLMGLDKF